MRKFTAEMVREMHQTYLSGDKTPNEVARSFGVPGSTRMYQLFTRFGMTERRPKTGMAPEAVRAMYAGYLTTKLPAKEYAAGLGMSKHLMYWWFRKFGLPVKSGANSGVPIELGESAKSCPAARTHEACAGCPCPEPKCKPGMEWHCGECAGKKRCVCWVAERRQAYGFGVWYAGWKTEQRREEDKWQRVGKLLQNGARRCHSAKAVW